MIPGKTILKVQDLHVVREHKQVLKGVDLSLTCGDMSLLTGPNGCGKTTLMRSIIGLLPCSTGSIELFDLDARSAGWKQQRHLLAYVPQEELYSQFPVSVYEMAEMGAAGLKLSRSQRIERVEKSLEDTGLWELRDRSYFSLSGGEKRRASLARCICQSAHLLLLDEPLTYLDAAARERFIGLLKDIHDEYNITILMVTHTEEHIDAREWDRFVIADGRISSDEQARS